MELPSRRGRGRPRASGRQAAIPAVELDSWEIIPFTYGLEHATELGTITQHTAPRLQELWPTLNARQRDIAASRPESWFISWVMVGVMQYHMQASVKIAKES